MSLEEELAINQFGQGVRSVADQLDEFNQLDEPSKRSLFVQFYCRVSALLLDNSSTEQALAECSVDVTDPIYEYLNLHRLANGSKGFVHIPHSAEPPGGNLDKPYTLLLHLFKIDYQRRYALEKGNPTNWRYWDLSNEEVAQSILARHRALVDEVYTDPGFRSEFASLAKLWYRDKMVNLTGMQEPDPEQKAHFEFMTYDEMVAASRDRHKISHAIMLLRNSLHNALSVRYKVGSEEAIRLILDVLKRHMRETYNTDLFY